MKQQPRRYENLTNEIRKNYAARIVEVGTCAGVRAELMIQTALENRRASEVSYFGFDLFGPSPGEELSPRVKAWPIMKVRDRLTVHGVNLHLYEGDSCETIPQAVSLIRMADLIFIDGGHSDETVQADWENLQPAIGHGTVVMFDDYWNYPGGGGCKKLVDGLDRSKWQVDVLSPMDSFEREYGTLNIQIARVRSA